MLFVEVERLLAIAGKIREMRNDENFAVKTAVNRYQHRQKKCAKERRQNQTYSIVFSLNF